MTHSLVFLPDSLCALVPYLCRERDGGQGYGSGQLRTCLEEARWQWQWRRHIKGDPKSLVYTQLSYLMTLKKIIINKNRKKHKFDDQGSIKQHHGTHL